MCATVLNTSLDTKKKELTKELVCDNKSESKLGGSENSVCILNKSITRIKRNNKVTSQLSLCIKSNNKKKFPEKEGSILNLPKCVISCRCCKTGFETVELCQNHLCTITESQSLSSKSVKYKCKPCLILSQEKNTLDKHMKNRSCHNCNHCDAQFTNHKELCKHLKKSHNICGPEKSFVCALCKKSFHKKVSLNLHMKIHANGKLSCTQCDLICEDEISYVEHVKDHLKNVKYKCQLCDTMFARSQQYNQHMMAHKKHICKLCNISYPSSKLLKKHQQNVHDMKIIKKHQCETCGKCFSRPLHLTVHQRVHTGEKPLKCLDCNKNYYSNETFSKHLKTVRHLKKVSKDNVNEILVEKKFTCEKCEAKFFKLQSLQRHTQMLHSTDEPLKCEHCSYSTKCKANLKRHSELHSQTKRFACELCGQTFRTLATLKDHRVFVHSDKRDFLCNLCDKSFKNNSDLQRHKKIHSNDRPYKCSCIRSFKRLSHLKRHMETSKHKFSVPDKCAQPEETNEYTKDRLEYPVDDFLESCDDPIQFSKTIENLLSDSVVISSSGVSVPDDKSSNDLYLSQDASLKGIKHPSLTLTDSVYTKKITVSQLPNVFENPVMTLTDQISTKNLSTDVNQTGEVPSQTAAMPLKTAMVTPPIMSLTNLQPSENTNSTMLTTDVEQSLLSFADNNTVSENISLLMMPSVIEQPVVNFVENNMSSISISTTEVEMASDLEQSVMNIVHHNLPTQEVTTSIIQDGNSVTNKTTLQSESPINLFESRSTVINIDDLSKFNTSNILKGDNYIQQSNFQLQNISPIVLPKSTAQEDYSSPFLLPNYSFSTQNGDLVEQSSVKDNVFLDSMPRSKSLPSAELSIIEQKNCSGDIPGPSDITNTFYISENSSQPGNYSLNTDFVDENFNQLPALFNFENITGPLNNSLESSVPSYPVIVNDLVVTNESVMNFLLNSPIFNTGFES